MWFPWFVSAALFGVLTVANTIARATKEPETGLLPTPHDWPSQGRVTFDNVSMRYRPELPLVLQNVSFDLKVRNCCCCPVAMR